MQKISILGSTGSIGTQALEVIDSLENREDFKVIGLSCNNNIKKLQEQIRKWRPDFVCVSSNEAYQEIKQEFSDIEVLFGEEGLIELSKRADILLTATTGTVALKPTIEAIKNKKRIALANKETLVMAGDIVMRLAKEHNAEILPVDSEHSAILQSAGDFKYVKNIIITASGGPFLNKSKEEIEHATSSDALKHPNWNMGKKITIDSSTLMNKGLEVIEAHHLFNMPYENIKVVIHPESLVHSAVEMKDGSVIAQIGNPSMHIPIQYALTYPKRFKGIKTDSFNFFEKELTFKKPDLDKFECLKLAIEAGKRGGIYPCVLNGANEIAVHKFLKDEITIKGIVKIVENALDKAAEIKNPTLEDILQTDRETRAKALEFII